MTKGINFFSMSRVETDRYQYACADKARACIVMAHKYITDGLRASEEHPVVRRKLVNMRTVIEEGILNTTACIVTPEDVKEEKPFVMPELERGDWGVVRGRTGFLKSRDDWTAEENAKRGFPPAVLWDEAKQWARATYRRIFHAR